MDVRRKIVIASVLVAAGVGAGVVFRSVVLRSVAWVVPATPERWAEQVRLDAISLLDVVRPDPRLPEDLAGQAEFRSFWEDRRSKYPPDRLADLRTRLHDYLDFLQAEYADCAEIYRNGPRERLQSDAAREARRRVTAGFGEFAKKTLLPQADELREEAYRASPKVAGYDPDLPDFVQEYDDLRAWLPRAHARVDELTAPPR
jgi:hypothetical protein